MPCSSRYLKSTNTPPHVQVADALRAQLLERGEISTSSLYTQVTHGLSLQCHLSTVSRAKTAVLSRRAEDVFGEFQVLDSALLDLHERVGAHTAMETHPPDESGVKAFRRAFLAPRESLVRAFCMSACTRTVTHARRYQPYPHTHTHHTLYQTQGGGRPLPAALLRGRVLDQGRRQLRLPLLVPFNVRATGVGALEVGRKVHTWAVCNPNSNRTTTTGSTRRT